MLLFVLGLIGLTLLVYLVLRGLTARKAQPLRPGPAVRRAPDDDEDFLRDLRRRMRDPREE